MCTLDPFFIAWAREIPDFKSLVQDLVRITNYLSQKDKPPLADAFGSLIFLILLSFFKHFGDIRNCFESMLLWSRNTVSHDGYQCFQFKCSTFLRSRMQHAHMGLGYMNNSLYKATSRHHIQLWWALICPNKWSIVSCWRFSMYCSKIAQYAQKLFT